MLCLTQLSMPLQMVAINLTFLSQLHSIEVRKPFLCICEIYVKFLTRLVGIVNERVTSFMSQGLPMESDFFCQVGRQTISNLRGTPQSAYF